MCAEVSCGGLPFERQRPLTLRHSDARRLRLDIVVEDRILIELEATEQVLPIHEAQVVTDLRLADLSVGLLVSFYVLVLKDVCAASRRSIRSPCALPRFLSNPRLPATDSSPRASSTAALRSRTGADRSSMRATSR